MCRCREVLFERAGTDFGVSRYDLADDGPDEAGEIPLKAFCGDKEGPDALRDELSRKGKKLCRTA